MTDAPYGRYRVRLQVQGGGVDLSVPFVQDAPVTAAQGLEGLRGLKSRLTPEELEPRMTAFERAERFIQNASLAGGIGPPGRSFSAPQGGGIRVDVEILRGVNFDR